MQHASDITLALEAFLSKADPDTITRVEELLDLPTRDPALPATRPDTSHLWSPQPGPQTEAFSSDADLLFYGGAAGGGKLLKNKEKILTPKGFVQNGDLRRGDIICDPSTGGQTRVLAVHPQGKKKMYRVWFDDDTYLDAGLEHLWLYRPNAHMRSKPNQKLSEQRDFAEETLGSSPLYGQKNIPWRVLSLFLSFFLTSTLSQLFLPS